MLHVLGQGLSVAMVLLVVLHAHAAVGGLLQHLAAARAGPAAPPSEVLSRPVTAGQVVHLLLDGGGRGRRSGTDLPQGA